MGPNTKGQNALNARWNHPQSSFNILNYLLFLVWPGYWAEMDRRCWRCSKPDQFEGLKEGIGWCSPVQTERWRPLCGSDSWFGSERAGGVGTTEVVPIFLDRGAQKDGAELSFCVHAAQRFSDILRRRTSSSAARLSKLSLLRTVSSDVQGGLRMEGNAEMRRSKAGSHSGGSLGATFIQRSSFRSGSVHPGMRHQTA